jgi:hypothetical protein
MNAMNTPGFTAERSLLTRTGRRFAGAETPGHESPDVITPAVPMPYCKYVCKWRVCGSALPGYPVPMCYSCEQECWIHDSGRYSRSFSM